MRVKYVGILLLAILTFYGCEDNTGTLGMGMLPDSDGITAKTRTFNVTTKSVLVDNVYAKTSTGYVGRFTDPDKNGGFGDYEASFLTQLNCTENFTFPAVYKENADGKSGTGSMVSDEVTSIQLTVYYSSWFGDSLNACRMTVQELNKVLDTKNAHKTSINPEDYYKAGEGFTLHKAYTAYDTSVPDSVRNATDSNGNSLYYPNITFPLSKEYGNQILKLNRAFERGENDYFKNSDKFIENVLKGVYIKTDYGDGTILYVDRVDLQMQFQFHYVDSLGLKLTKKVTDDKGKVGEDSLYYSMATVFASTKEVIQANRFKNSDLLKKRADETEHTYLKSPAGIFTEATLPYDDINKELTNDTLNAVKLTFTNYNQENKYKFSMSAPQTVLLVRKKDMNSFFEHNELTDNITSFVASHNNVATNQYTFKNIARLVSTCINEKKAAKIKAGASWDEKQWMEKNEDWNKVMIIPVSVTYDTNTTSPTMTGIQHDLRPTAVKLEGGPEGPSLKIEVTYTSFK